MEYWIVSKKIDFDGGKPIEILKDKSGKMAIFKGKKDAHKAADEAFDGEDYYMLTYEAWGEQ